MIRYHNRLKDQLLDYYGSYYESLGLPDHNQHVLNRLNEDDLEFVRLKKLEDKLSISIKDFNCHLIVGLGTGGLAVALKAFGIEEIIGIEPSMPALKIAREKAKLIDLQGEMFQQAVAEKIPCSDGEFDFVHCFSVLEHVQDIRQSIREMYRVLRPGGILYIHTPNYSWPYEGHYKVPAPVFMPYGKIITKLWLMILGRPIEYLESINFISERDLNYILKDEVECYHRLYSKKVRMRHIPQGNDYKAKLVKLMYSFFNRFLDIYPYQEIIIKKI